MFDNNDINHSQDLAREHRALLAGYASAQLRCSRMATAQQGEIAAQRRQIERLESDVVRLRAESITRMTALAFERADRVALEAQIPGLPKRRALAGRVEGLGQRVHALMRELLRREFWQPARALQGRKAGKPAQSVLCIARDEGGHVFTRRMAEDGQLTSADEPMADEALLEASLVAADLVICQTGCVTHDAYWRVQDHCKRTGKTCVLVDQPQAMMWLRGGRTDHRLQAFMPPSMVYDEPVTNCDSWLASHATSAATSGGEP